MVVVTEAGDGSSTLF
jgi:hypothetical protein